MDGGSIPPISTTAVVARCGPDGRPTGWPFVVSSGASGPLDAAGPLIGGFVRVVSRSRADSRIYSLIFMAKTLDDRRALVALGARRPWSRFVAALLVVGALVVAQFVSPATSGPAPSASAATPCTGGSLTVVAHTDDDLLFLNPHILQDIQAGRCTRVVYTTAGEAGEGAAYWGSLESGIRATYAQMAGVANRWTAANSGVTAGAISVHTLTAAPHVSVVFLRIPDGFDGSGSAPYGYESLQKLWNGEISLVHTVDDKEWYTKNEVRDILVQLMTSFAPKTVRTQDWSTDPNNLDDHSDHWATAMFARLASGRYTAPHTLLAYEGYPIWDYPANVTGPDLQGTIDAFVTFAGYDKFLCSNPNEGCPEYPHDVWLERQYLVASEPTKNAVRETGVIVAASSTRSTSQAADRASDGYPVGAPMDAAREWVTNNQGVGGWIQFTFPKPTPLEGITLYDRPNTADQITGATLQFSDGGTMPVAALPNNGAGLTVTFPVRTVTSVRLNVTAVSATTTAAGLAEFEAWRGPADTTAPVVTASPGGGEYAVGQPITLTANEPATIYYTTDGTAPTTTSRVYSGPVTLTAGFTLRYLAVDTAGNVSAAGQQVYRVPAADTTAPIVTVTPAGGRYEVGRQITMTTNEPAKIHYTTDGSAPTASSPVYSAPLTITGSFTLRYFAVDPAGNASAPASQSYSVPGPPAIVLPSNGQTVGRTTTIQLQGDPGSTFRCTLDPASGGQQAPCASGDVLTFGTEGSHTLQVVGVDAAGTVSPPSSVTFTVSFAAPAPVISVPAADGSTTTAAPSFEFSAPGTTNATFRCKLDAQAFAPCTSPRAYTGVAAGAHTFTVEATNALGNTGTTARTFTVVVPDTTPPTITATPIGGTYAKGRSITLSANESARIHYTVDGSVPTTSSPIYSAPLSLQTSFELRYLGVDTAGNQSAVGSQRYTVQVVKPAGPSHDFDGDGRADVMARDTAGNLWLHPGDGAGGWQPARQIGTGWNVMTTILVPGDFDGDGKVDVLARDTTGRLLLYPGDGVGGWRAPSQVGSGWNIMRSIVGPGDFNGDGRVDVLAIDPDYRMILYPGNGSGGWLSPVQVGSGWGIMNAVVGAGDVNGDRAVDVLARGTDGTLHLYPGNGQGGWGTRSTIGGGWGALNPIIGPGDFNGDGFVDVLARTSSGGLQLYPGNGAGGLGPATTVGSGWSAFSAIM